MDKLLAKIKEIKDWEGSQRGKPGNKPGLRKLRQEFYDMAVPLLEDTMHLVVGDYVIEKWYDPPSGKTRAMIFTKESFERKENARKEFDLSWIK